MELIKKVKEICEKGSKRFKYEYDTVKNWCYQNKEFIIVFGPIIFGGLMEIIKITTKSTNINEEKRLKERYIYDHSMGHYYELRRKPKKSEWIQIDQRKRNGESLGWILNDMRLLK